MLRIAVPNKGALSEPAANLLAEAGYRVRSNTKELVLVDEANGVELFYLRPRDIAVYVGSGTVDIGITGRDMLVDSRTPFRKLMDLGFARSTFRLAGDADAGWSVEQLDGKRIATSYEGLVEDWLSQRSISCEVVHLDGAVESSIRLGVADVIADVVETGSTLRSAGLSTFGESLMTSEAILFEGENPPTGDPDRAAKIERLMRRLRGVLVARDYVLMDYDIRTDLVDKASGVTPGMEAPTVSPLQGGDWSAVRVMVRAEDTNTIMDRLYEIGARAILITDIRACRL